VVTFQQVVGCWHFGFWMMSRTRSSVFSYYTQKTLFIFAYANTMYNFLISCWSGASRHLTNFGLFIHAELEDRRLVTGQKQIDDGNTGPH
jgi:hypothetical protein